MSKESLGPALLVIFGATGDLTKRKLIPALYSMFERHEIDEHNPIICVARKDFSTDKFINELESDVFIKNKKSEVWEKFSKNIHYYSFDFGSATCGDCQNCNRCNPFSAFIANLDQKYQTGGNALFYMATSPSLFENISRVIEQSGFFKTDGWKRVAFEKPFGSDLTSARELNAALKLRFKEEQTYRIDHYLGKALVQEIMAFRFSNAIFEQVWNNQFIEHIQISVPESITIESRAGYYDKSGAIRDMFQNHLMQLLSLTLMERPLTMSSTHIKDAKINVLRALETPTRDDIVVGQYEGYLSEDGVASDSKTETYVAVRTFVNTPRWNGVPIYLRTGKGLKNSFAEINLVLKNVATGLFKAQSEDHVLNNIITIRIQPDTGIALTFNSKMPGHGQTVNPATMNFCHHCKYKDNTPEAYESLFASMILGDQTIFPRWDGIELSWKYTDLLRKIVSNEKLHQYELGTIGPNASDELLLDREHHWINNSFVKQKIDKKDLKIIP